MAPSNDQALIQRRKSASIVMLSTLASRILGIIRISLVSRIFGAGVSADVINFSFNIPNNLRKLLAEGALSSSFIPALKSCNADDNRHNRSYSRLFVRQLITYQLLLLIPVCALLCIFAFPITRFLSDFTTREATVLSSRLLQYFTLYIMMIALIATMGSVLNSKDRFIATSLSPLMFSVCIIVSIMLLSESMGVYAFVVGVLSGGSLGLLLLFIPFSRDGFSLLPTKSLRSVYISQCGNSYLPVLLSSSIAMLTQQVSFYLASTMSSGSVTAFSNAIIFYQLPYGLFFNSVATVFFPKMSEYHVAGDKERVGKLLEEGIRQLLFFLVPSMIILLFLSQEFAASLLLKGAYTLENTLLAAKTTRMYALGLIPVALYSFLLRYCYASGRYSLALRATLLISCIDIAFSVGATRMGADVSSLALANTIAFLFALLFILLALAQSDRLPIRSFILQTIRFLLRNIPLSLCLWGYGRLFPSWWQTGVSGMNILFCALISLCAGLVVLLSYQVTGIDVKEVLTGLKRSERGQS